MRSILLFLVFIFCLKYSYQKGPVLDLDPYIGSFKEGTITIPQYYPLTEADQLSTLRTSTLVSNYVKRNKKKLDPFKRAKLGPFKRPSKSSPVVTLYNFTLAGFTTAIVEKFEVRAKPGTWIGQADRLRLDARIVFPKETMKYDFNVDFREYGIYDGHLDAWFHNTTLIAVTELTRLNFYCNIVAHSNHLNIHKLQVQLDIPGMPCLQDNKPMIQGIVDRYKPHVFEAGGRLLMEYLQTHAEKICKEF